MSIPGTGWGVLTEREELMLRWQAILAGEAPTEVEYSAAEACPGEDMAYVVCTETIGETQLIATNVFLREADVWKMVHHHAGPVVQCRARREEPKSPSSGGMLN